MPSRVLERVLQAVFADLDEPQDCQDGKKRCRAIGEERESRQEEQCVPHPHEPQDARDREELQEQADQVVPGEVICLESPNECLRRLAMPVRLASGNEQRPVEEILAGAVDPVEEHNQAGDQQEVFVPRYEVERALRRKRLVGACLVGFVLRRQRASLDPHDQSHAREKNDHRRAHEHAGPERHERSREPRPYDRADGTAAADDRKEPFALLRGVDVGGDRPKLRDHRVAEDADPKKERQANLEIRAREDREDDQV